MSLNNFMSFESASYETKIEVTRLQNDDFHGVDTHDDMYYMPEEIALGKDEYHLCDRVIFSALPSDGIYPSFIADIWLNVPDDFRVIPTEGKVYLHKDSPYCTTPKVAKFHSLMFTSVDNTDADFEIFRPVLDILIRGCGMSNIVKKMESTIRGIATKVKTSKKKKKKSNDSESAEAMSAKIPDFQRECEDFLMSRGRVSKSEMKYYSKIVKTVVSAVIQLKIVPMIPIAEVKENPHVSRRKKA